MKRFTIGNWISFIVFFLSFLLACMLLLSGCEVLKGKKSFTQDSVSVKKQQSAVIDTGNGGSVIKQQNSTKEAFDWYRMTQLFDSNKQLPGETKVYPSTVIYEGGKGTKEQNSSTIDSSWFKNALQMYASSVDSLNNKIATMEKNKQSETKGVGLIMVIIIAFGAVFVYGLLRYFLKGYSITKKGI